MNYPISPNGRAPLDPHAALPRTADGPTEAAGKAPPPFRERAVSPELEGYLARARETPQIPPEQLAQVLRRLENGYYLTPAAAEQTARHIPDGDLGPGPANSGNP